MTQLRQQLIRDLKTRNYSKRTVDAYVYYIDRFAKHFKRSPAELGKAEIQLYQQYLVEVEKPSWSTFNCCVCALKFLYETTLGRPGEVSQIPYARRPKKLPVVLSEEEVAGLLAALQNPKYRIAFMTAYSAGLRVGETAYLRVEDIDSARMMIFVRHAKGQKERFRSALTAALGRAPRLLSSGASEDLALPGCKLHQANLDSIAATRRERSGKKSWNSSPIHLSFASTFVRNACARERRGPADCASAARAQPRRDHDDLHTRPKKGGARSKSARSVAHSGLMRWRDPRCRSRT